MDNTRLESSELTVELCGHRSPQLSIFSYFCIAYSDTMVSTQLLDEVFLLCNLGSVQSRCHG